MIQFTLPKIEPFAEECFLLGAQLLAVAQGLGCDGAPDVAVSQAAARRKPPETS